MKPQSSIVRGLDRTTRERGLDGGERVDIAVDEHRDGDHADRERDQREGKADEVAEQIRTQPRSVVSTSSTKAKTNPASAYRIAPSTGPSRSRATPGRSPSGPGRRDDEPADRAFSGS